MNRIQTPDKKIEHNLDFGIASSKRSTASPNRKRRVRRQSHREHVFSHSIHHQHLPNFTSYSYHIHNNGGQNPTPTVLLTLITVVSSTPALSDDPTPTVYQILEKYGHPTGILPDSVISYSLAPDDGSFVVELEKPCYIQFDYLVYYDTKITGKLSVGSITDLDGIQVKTF